MEGAVEGAHMGHPDFRAHGKIFATLHPDLQTGMVKLTPAHLDALRDGEYAGATQFLVIGGEALRAESVAPWREHAPETRLINEYGPT